MGDLKKQVANLKKQLDQGPQQLQGEVYELHLENTLRRNFAGDEIVEVPKGVSGADVIQRVCTAAGSIAGSISGNQKIQSVSTRRG